MKKNRIISCLLCIVFIATLAFNSIAFAATESTWSVTQYSGSCGKNNTSKATWKMMTATNAELINNVYDNERLVISGSDEMEDYTQYTNGRTTSPWYDIIWDSNSIVVEEGITRIGDNAFIGATSICYISLPESLQSIGHYAFSSALKYVKKVTIPENVTYIGQYAFCSNEFTEVEILGDVEVLQESVFSSCQSLKTVTIPKSVTEIQDYAFDYCTSLTDIYYDGTRAEWEEISIGYGNSYLLNATVHFPTVSVESVALDKSSKTMFVGSSFTLTPSISPENADNKTISWKSSNSSVATVNNGVVTAVSPGTATITVTTADGNKTATCTVSVQASTVSVSGIELNKSEIELEIGDTEVLTATISPTNATNKSVTWTTSNENVVSVQNGTLTAKETGDAIITVTTTDGGYSDTCYVSVIEPIVNVTGIELNITSEEIYQGASIPIQAIITPENATNKEIIWTSSNENVVVVDRSGEQTNAHAVSVGTATITATTVDGSKSAECIIVVKERKPSSGGDSGDEPSDELTLTRGSMCAKIVEAFGFELTEQVEETPFSDIDETDEYYEEILICSQLEIVSGYEDGTFKPNGAITNAEVAKLIYNTLSYIGWSVEIPEDADYDKTMWYGQYAWLVEDLGIMTNIDNWFDVATEESITSMLGSIGYVYQKRISESFDISKYVLEVGNNIVLRDNEEIECNLAPILNEGIIFASIRSFADLLNLAVEYNGETKEVTFVGWNKILKYTVGDENCILINGATYANAELIFTEIIGTDYIIVADEEKLVATGKCTYINVGNATTRNGQEVTIPISISNNTGLSGLQFECNYDDVLTLTNVEVGTALNGLNFTAPGDLTANPVTLLWDGMDADESNGEILILTFKVDDNAEIGEYDISLTVKSAIDQELNPVDLKIKGGTISVVEYISGDVDENGEVNSRDIVLTRRFVAGGYDVSILEVAADVDASGDVNSRDIVLMRRYVAGGYGVELE